jgi:hypothetical protein
VSAIILRRVRGSTKTWAMFFVFVAAIAAALFYHGGALLPFVRESFMQRATSAHYEILCPRGALSQGAMEDFANSMETSFASMNKKLDGAAANVKIRIVFENEFVQHLPIERDPGTFYLVSGRTIRATLDGKNPQLSLEADAQAILNTAWGDPKNQQIGWWTMTWLAGEWRGKDIGMAAAQLEQNLGHTRLAIVLSDPADNKFAYVEDQNLLGAAWISEVAELGGMDEVHKLYSAKTPRLTVAEVAKLLGTTPLELDRKWQLWMYSYLAGMPSMPHDSGMQMDMPMGGGNR